MVGHVEPKDASSPMLDREPDVQDPEGHRRDHEEVHRGDHVAMVAQEHKPARHDVWTGWTPRQVARGGALGHVEVEYEKLAVDPLRSPSRILGRHTPDEGTELGIKRRTALMPASREPRPIATKAGSMPPNDRLRFDEHEGVEPARPRRMIQNQRSAKLMRG